MNDNNHNEVIFFSSFIVLIVISFLSLILYADPTFGWHTVRGQACIIAYSRSRMDTSFFANSNTQLHKPDPYLGKGPPSERLP